MAIVLGSRSRSNMVGLDPRLSRVILRAAQMATPEEDFMVIEGVRSTTRMWELWGKGRTIGQCVNAGVPSKYAKPNEAKVTWLKNPLMSNHRMQQMGGKAADMVPFPVDWKDTARFDRLNDLMMRAAAAEDVKIRWGADWDQDGNPRERGETDSPHWELAE